METPAQLYNPETGKPELKYEYFIYQPLKDERDQTISSLAFILDASGKAWALQQVLKLNEKLQASITELGVSSEQPSHTNIHHDNFIYTASHDLKVIIADVQSDQSPCIQAVLAQVCVDVSASLTISFTEKNMRSLLYNLLSNAIKNHFPELTPLVQVCCHTTGEYHVLTVQDNGLGIGFSKEHKLFRMFRRLPNHVEGSGGGLYRVKRIAENAGGKIEVESKVGEGSLFQVCFKRNL